MFGFFKNLLRKPLVAVAERLNSGSAPAEPGPAEAEPAPPPPLPSHVRKTPGPGNSRGVEVPLQSILSVLPLELQPKVLVSEVGEATITIPLEKVLAQLSRGAVKISFGELRQAVPEVFTTENDRDRVLISLPLNEILPRLNPALITRRRVQRQVEVPAEVSSPFDDNGQGLVFSIGPDNGKSAPSAPARQTAAVPPVAPRSPARSTLTSAPTPAAPGLNPPPAPPNLKPKPVSVAGLAKPAPVTAPKPVSVTPPRPAPVTAPKQVSVTAQRPTVSPAAPKSVPMAPPSTPAPAAPVVTASPSLPKHAPVPFKPVPAAPVRPAPPPVRAEPVEAQEPYTAPEPEPVAWTPPAAPVPQPKPAAAPGEVLTLALTSLADGWPDAIRTEIVEMNLVDARVALPVYAVEQALKQGKVAFSWKLLRSWIKPTVLPAVSAHDGMVLELPLKVVAPQFLALQKKTAKPQHKVSIDEEIPNLFFGFPQPEPAVPVAQATASPGDTNYYVWDDSSDRAKVDETDFKRGPSPGTRFVAKYATPNEVVSRAAALDHVAGVLIALPDGLMVANRLPADVNADTIAAFLPQIFGKVSQCTKELRMGDLNNLNFTVGSVPWKIFRVNAIFFAAFGRTGRPLPTGQLAALAAELDHKPK